MAAMPAKLNTITAIAAISITGKRMPGDLSTESRVSPVLPIAGSSLNRRAAAARPALGPKKCERKPVLAGLGCNPRARNHYYMNSISYILILGSGCRPPATRATIPCIPG